MNELERNAVDTIMECLSLDADGDWFSTSEGSERIASALDVLKASKITSVPLDKRHAFMNEVQNYSDIRETLKFLIDRVPLSQLHMVFRATSHIQFDKYIDEVSTDLAPILDSFRLLLSATEHLERNRYCK